ncbi:MAG: Bifunctional NMN adenylyltransferase/Nudix hydrolase [candidate division WS6 bacterium OLB21]|uniref:Bifunctional NMN adenylyltransferase/Nudix hydrolase n=1 Tax=candidate division WS6 bacterium OLB21 TaxID=1617427 RepID=A0A136KHN9_9BACT|nr:MAG: Bifunctional NMN adenylyltransferase/Nudix hydrolase [candidate division WS6 bacterium OLB21]
MKKYLDRVLTVDCLVVNSEGKVLFVTRAAEPYKNYLALPGGYMNFDETAEQAVIREVKEETGIILDKVEMFAVYDDPKRDPKQRVSILFIAFADGIPKAADDAHKAEFLEVDKIDPTKLAFDHGQMLEDFIEMQSI